MDNSESIPRYFENHIICFISSHCFEIGDDVAAKSKVNVTYFRWKTESSRCFELTFHLSNSFLLLCMFKSFFYCAFFNKCCLTLHLSVVHQRSPFSSIFLQEAPFSSVLFLIVIIFKINLVSQQVQFRNPVLYFPKEIHGLFWIWFDNNCCH